MGGVLASMGSGPVLAMVLLFVVHVIGMAVFAVMMGRDVLEMFRTSPPYSDDDWGEPPAGDPVMPTPPSGGGLPLPDAEQAPNRLREPGRLGERYPKPPRRPEHAPERTPAPDPSHR